jgi:hypothetical protein
MGKAFDYSNRRRSGCDARVSRAAALAGGKNNDLRDPCGFG